MAQLPQIKPCPFCGGPAEIEQTTGATSDHKSVGFSVGCTADEADCMGYQSLTTFARRSDAIDAWNRRATDAEIERLNGIEAAALTAASIYEAEIGRLRALLEPFAELARAVLAEAPADASYVSLLIDRGGVSRRITLDDMRAVDALQQSANTEAKT